jgi:hypothetical protein
MTVGYGTTHSLPKATKWPAKSAHALPHNCQTNVNIECKSGRVFLTDGRLTKLYEEEKEGGVNLVVLDYVGREGFFFKLWRA